MKCFLLNKKIVARKANCLLLPVVILASLFFFNVMADDKEGATSSPRIEHLRNGYSHVVLDRFVEKMRLMHEHRKAELAQLKTREDAMAYRDKVRRNVAAAFGPFPEKCPLEPVVSGSVKCDGYKIENVRFCSRPGFWVTCNLYLPEGVEFPCPAVVGLCGHSNSGKMDRDYQQFAIRLAQNGFIVLMVDPIHQGERNQYVKFENVGLSGWLCEAHNSMGLQLGLVGESMASWRVWDGIRAIDYLMTRPEVDVKKIGVTGNSGGGTLTEWLWANDDRLAFAAPSCHVTTFLANIENELPTDAEQCPPGILQMEMEMIDMMICQAPKPAILLGQKYDFFERRGFAEASDEIKHFYALLGEEDNIDVFQGPTTHGFSVHNQKAMVEFFLKCVGRPGAMVEKPVEPQPKDVLSACREGSVVLEGSKTLMEMVEDKANMFQAEYRQLSQDDWRKIMSELLVLPERPAEPPHYRVLRPQKSLGGGAVGRYAVETEEGIRAVLYKHAKNDYLLNTLETEKKICLYLPDFSSEEDFACLPWVNQLDPDEIVYSLDVRGLGEVRPEESRDWAHQLYGMDYMMGSVSIMFGESYFGRRVFDVLRTIDLLKAEDTQDIVLVGRGQGALLAVYTAMLCPEISHVTLYDAPSSYREWINNGACDWSISNMVHGVLKYFDLPDLYTAIGERLTIKSHWDTYLK